jgi:hypothetical protein
LLSEALPSAALLHDALLLLLLLLLLLRALLRSRGCVLQMRFANFCLRFLLREGACAECYIFSEDDGP